MTQHLIDRDALLQLVMTHHHYFSGCIDPHKHQHEIDQLINDIQDAPVINAIDVEWLKTKRKEKEAETNSVQTGIENALDCMCIDSVLTLWNMNKGEINHDPR